MRRFKLSIPIDEIKQAESFHTCGGETILTIKMMQRVKSPLKVNSYTTLPHCQYKCHFWSVAPIANTRCFFFPLEV